MPEDQVSTIQFLEKNVSGLIVIEIPKKITSEESSMKNNNEKKPKTTLQRLVAGGMGRRGFPDSTRRGNKWKRGHNDDFKLH